MVKLENVAAERSVLAGLLNFGRNFYLEICDFTGTSSFCKEIHQILYSIIYRVLESEETVTIPSMLAKATQLGLDAHISKNIEVIKALQQFPVDYGGSIAQAKIIRKLEITRNARAKLKEVYDSLEKVTGEESIYEILAQVESPILDFTTGLSTGTDNSPERIFANVDLYLEHLADNPVQNIGIPTPWPLMNGALGGGLRLRAVSIIASRTGVGKSHIGRAVSVHTALNNVPSLLLDTELTKDKQIARTSASISKVFIQHVETGQFGVDPTIRNKVINDSKILKTIPFDYMTVAGKSFGEILSIVRRWVIKQVGKADGDYRPSLLVFDYMKLMGADGTKEAKEYQVLGQNITMLQDLCVQYNVACLTFVQTNRDGISVEDLSIIAGSDRLSHLASNVCVMKMKTPEEINEDGINNGNIKFLSLKSRDGSSLGFDDYINYQREGQYSTFREVGLRSTLKNKAFESDDKHEEF